MKSFPLPEHLRPYGFKECFTGDGVGWVTSVWYGPYATEMASGNFNCGKTESSMNIEHRTRLGHIQKPRHCGICGKRKLSQQFLALRRLSYIPQPSVSSSHWTVAAPHISITQLEEERKSRKILSSGWGQVACHKGQVACHCPYEPIWAQCTHKSPYGLNEPIWAR